MEKRHKYIQSEIDYIKENYPKNGPDYCADYLNLSRRKVIQCANKHGVYFERTPLHIWTDEEIELLKKIYPNSSTKTTAKELGLTGYIIRRQVDKLKLKLLPKNERLCIDCKINFQSLRRYGFRCRDCFNKYKGITRREKPSTERQRFNELVQTIRYRSKKMGIISDITVDYLEELFAKQRGRCYYSGIPMNFERFGTNRKKYSVSVDQVIPRGGYTKNNVVLCTWAANAGKNIFSESEYIEFCKSVYEYHSEINKSD